MSIRWTVMILFALAVLSLLACANAQREHIPAVGCGNIYYSGYDPPSPKSLDDLEPAARARLSAYLIQRLGSDYAAKLTLAGGQVVDRDELLVKAPQSVDYQWRPPKYNLHFNVPVASDRSDFCASIQLDDDGTVMEPIGLPDLGKHPERGNVVPASEATAVAQRNGVPIDDATRELYYFPDTDTIEYDFQFVKSDDGLRIVYSHFHVLAHDPLQVHWSESSAIR